MRKAMNPHKNLRVAKGKLSYVLFGIKAEPLSEREWGMLAEISAIIGKIRSDQMAWLQKKVGDSDVVT